MSKAEEVQHKILLVGKLFRHNMKWNLEELGLTMSQGMLVGLLVHKGKMKVGAISKELNLSNATVSGLVDRLEKQGKVHRVRSVEDRRSVYVELDSEFKALMKSKHDSVNEKMLEPFFEATNEELDKVLEGLEIMERLLGGK